MSRSLRRLSDRYGGDEVRRAAPNVVQGMASAQQHGGISLQRLAEAAGYEDPADYLGGEVEQRIWAGSGRPAGEPEFPHAGAMSPQAWGAGPSPYDYRAGAELAETVGRPANIDAYARLAHRVRDPSLGAGQGAVDQLQSAAAAAQHLGAEQGTEGGFRAVAWPHFSQRAQAIGQDVGLERTDMPMAWLVEQQFLAAHG